MSLETKKLYHFHIKPIRSLIQGGFMGRLAIQCKARVDDFITFVFIGDKTSVSLIPI